MLDQMADPQNARSRFLVPGFMWWTGTTVILLFASICNGDPILGPDLSSCLKPIFPLSEGDQHCCIPSPKRPIKDFQFPTDLPMRVRRPAHSFDEASVRKFERAVALMRALPEDDPRNWNQQSQLHCAYAGCSHYQLPDHGVDNSERQRAAVHFTWFFLPFHRWFTYFQERILAGLLGDDTFALPYWAWDVQNLTNPASNVIPSMFTNEESSLYDPRRCRSHAPPQRVLLEVDGCPNVREEDYIRSSNYYNMWRVMLGEGRNALAFHGGKMSFGDSLSGGMHAAGVLEMGCHAAVHSWTGDDRCLHLEDMGTLSQSVKDPIFPVHHAQVDRLWEIWQKFGGKDVDHPDFLHAQFLFYDENADLVRVNVSQALDLEKLRISYEDLLVDWVREGSSAPSSIRVRGDPKFQPIQNVRNSRSEWVRNIAHVLRKWIMGTKTRSGTRTLVTLRRSRSVATASTTRPEASPLSVRKLNSMVAENGTFASRASDFDEVLVIRGVVSKPFSSRVRFKVFFELPEADETTPQDCLESMGQVLFDAGGLRSREDIDIVQQKFIYRVGMSERLAALRISSRTSPLAITFIPAWDPQYDPDVKIEITELKMELLSV